MQELIENFKQLCQIPHCSFETKEMENFLSTYAKDKGFKVNIDQVGNIHCVKGKPKICLQSHYDMVCMGVAPKIEIYEEQGYMKAKNSSLGADNGVGIAIMMQAMSKFENLECLFTNNEEVGLLGANGLEHVLEANMLLNLDHESEDEIIVGCAGGVDIEAKIEFSTEEKFGTLYTLEAKNFKGGHSGIDIIENPKNSIKEMAEFIFKNGGEIVSFEGGERINSIPKFAKAVVCFEKEIKGNDFIECSLLGKQKFQSLKESKILLQALVCFAQGVRSYDKSLKIVQSSINLSLLKMQDKQIKIELFARSNKLEELKKLEFETLEFFKVFNFQTRSYNFYPPWEGEENALSNLVFDELKKVVSNAQISAIHAGLECGIIEKKQREEKGKTLLCASIGPNIHNPHSTDERLELASADKISKVVLNVINKV